MRFEIGGEIRNLCRRGKPGEGVVEMSGQVLELKARPKRTFHLSNHMEGKMKRHLSAFILMVLLMGPLVTVSSAEETATPQECIQKCQEAAKFLAGEAAKGPEAEKAALAYLNQQENNRFVWKDTYVWVLCCDCEPKTNAAHPINQKIVGPDLSGMKDKQGKLFFLQFCETSKNQKGGWVEYWWPKVGEKKASRKITYVVKVPGTKYQVGAGVYDDSLNAQGLSQLIK